MKRTDLSPLSPAQSTPQTSVSTAKLTPKSTAGRRCHLNSARPRSAYLTVALLASSLLITNIASAAHTPLSDLINSPTPATPAPPAQSAKPAKSTPVPSGPASGTSLTPPSSFDPDQFNPLTSSTLPLENGKRIIMRVNGYPVTWDDFIAQVRLAGAAIYAQHPGKEANIAAALLTPLRDSLISQAIYNQFADEHHLTPEIREIQNRTGKMIQDRDPRAIQILKRLTPEQIQSVARDALVRDKVAKYWGDRATSVPATQTELSSFTTAMRPTTSPMTVLRASHIVLRATPDMSQFNINDAKAKADEIRAKLLDDDTTVTANGTPALDFVTAARQYSQDRFTAYLGGDLGYFEAGTMYPAVNDALEKLKPGDISPVVRSSVGFHIFKLIDRRDSDLVLQYDKWRSAKAVLDWQDQARKTAVVEQYLKP